MQVNIISKRLKLKFKKQIMKMKKIRIQRQKRISNLIMIILKIQLKINQKVNLTIKLNYKEKMKKKRIKYKENQQRAMEDEIRELSKMSGTIYKKILKVDLKVRKEIKMR